jgi:flagellar biosynthesis protein FlhA
MAGFTVVDCATVVATHLSHLMQLHAAKLLGRVETQQLVEHVTKLAPKMIEDVVPKMVGIPALQRVLQLLLEEGVHIRDMRSIVESLAENASTVTDPAELARRIRVHLAPPSCSRSMARVKELDVIALEPELERLVAQALNSPHGAALDPGVADSLEPQRRRFGQAPGRPGPTRLPVGARRDPRAHGPSAQARRTAFACAGPQRNS